MLSVRGITKSFGATRALAEVDLEVASGEVVALLGPNGAGKTTLLRILATLVIPDSGSALVGGFDVVRQAADARRQIGLVVGDERAWYWRLSALENLRFFGVLSGLSIREARARGAELLEESGLGDVSDRRVGQFSAGMRGRLGLARALIGRPRVLILDEATRSIDPVGSLEFRTRVRMLADERGLAVLMATHDLHEASSTADSVVVLAAGEVTNRLPGGSVDRLDAAIRDAAR